MVPKVAGASSSLCFGLDWRIWPQDRRFSGTHSIPREILGVGISTPNCFSKKKTPLVVVEL